MLQLKCSSLLGDSALSGAVTSSIEIQDQCRRSSPPDTSKRRSPKSASIFSSHDKCWKQQLQETFDQWKIWQSERNGPILVLVKIINISALSMIWAYESPDLAPCIIISEKWKELGFAQRGVGDEPGQDSNGPDRHAGATVVLMMTMPKMTLMMMLMTTAYPSFLVLVGI